MRINAIISKNRALGFNKIYKNTNQNVQIQENKSQNSQLISLYKNQVAFHGIQREQNPTTVNAIRSYELSELQKKLGTYIRNEELLNKAFIHFSALGDLGYKSSKYDNYTMAKIGSELMKASILRMIYQQNDDASLQELTGTLNSIMSEENLSDISQKLGLDKYIVADEEPLKTSPKNVMANVLKAYVAAIALDDKDYGMDDAFSFVSKIFQSSIE